MTSLALTTERPQFVNDPRDPCWGYPGFPDFVTEFRDHQWQAFCEITNHLANGVDVVLVDAPVGSGKTLIAEMVRRWVAERSLYVCSGKALQDQFVRDFPYAKLLKGRANYPTADHPELLDADFHNRVTAKDCDKEMSSVPACDSCPPSSEDFEDIQVMHCSECHPVTACPYDQAKAIALASNLACVNTSYFLAEANGPGKLRKRGLVVVDECDMVEKELMSFFEVSISQRRMRQLNLRYPKRKTVTAGLKQHDLEPSDWEQWFEHAIDRVTAAVYMLPRQGGTREQRRERDYLVNLRSSLKMVAERILDGGWVYTDYERGNVTFKPVTVDAFGADVFWGHGARWLMMSGTIIDPEEMVTSLGIPEHMNWALVTVPMTFPKENRPLHVLPVAEMSAKNKAEAWPKMRDRILDIVARHPEDRILIHGVSYELSNYIFESLPLERRITYSGSSEREAALERYKAQPAAVLVGPSMDRGVDLPGDLCRVQVICKLPFPYLGDKQISTRLYGTRGGQQWYLIQCIRSFVQMTGRGVRNADDHAVTYILDKAFQNNIWKKGRKLIPSYMAEAIDWSGRLPAAPTNGSQPVA